MCVASGIRTGCCFLGGVGGEKQGKSVALSSSMSDNLPGVLAKTTAKPGFKAAIALHFLAGHKNLNLDALPGQPRS